MTERDILRPGLVSLWDLMKLFEAQRLVLLREEIERLTRVLQQALDRGATPPKEMCVGMAKLLDGHRELIESVGKNAAYVSIMRAISYLEADPCDAEAVVELLREIPGRVHDELLMRSVYYLTPEQSEMYAGKHRFSEAVVKRYGHAVDDMEEAAKCFALERYTACVFHLMRVIEAGLLDLGRLVGLRDHKPSWRTVLKAIRHVLEDTKYQDRTPELQRHTRLLNDVLPQMHAIERAWRNKVDHFETHIVPTGEYTQEKAESIFVATRSLMDLLATELADQPKTANSR